MVDAKFVDAKTLSKMLGVSTLTVRRLERDGFIPAGTRVGKRLIRWDVSAVEKYLHQPNANRKTR
jgi:excisionase family DNA binding protein